ncbi:PerC family transcriptional regulator [Salmonella enterica]|nr:PerC family transcriptional regulator [Salmonella enterica]
MKPCHAMKLACRSAVRLDSYGGVREAANRTQASMGLDRPDGAAFRNYPKSR